MMSTVTVSPKFQVVIPKDVRNAINLKPGQKLVAMAWGKTIALVPDYSLEDVQEMFAGVENDFIRDRYDRNPYPL